MEEGPGRVPDLKLRTSPKRKGPATGGALDGFQGVAYLVLVMPPLFVMVPP